MVNRVWSSRGEKFIGRHWGELGLYWRYMGIMEKKMQSTILGYIGFRVRSYSRCYGNLA